MFKLYKITFKNSSYIKQNTFVGKINLPLVFLIKKGGYIVINENNVAQTKIKFKQAKRKREELYLERLYYAAVDPFEKNSWVNVLGAKTFVTWLQLQTLVDRSEEGKEKYNNEGYTVPRSIKQTAILLGMSRTTLYENLKILWNYGFIDFEEWEQHNTTGQKAINILVYPYPQNDLQLQHQPLQKIRDYNTEYSSNARKFNLKTAVKRLNKEPHMQPTTPYRLEWLHDEIVQYLKKCGFKEKICLEIKQILNTKHQNLVTPIRLVEEQLLQIENYLKNGNTIYDFPKYFTKGLADKIELYDSMDNFKNYTREQLLQTNQTTAYTNKVIFYDWLSEVEEIEYIPPFVKIRTIEDV